MSNSSGSPKAFEGSGSASASIWKAAHGENQTILEEAARRIRFVDFPDLPFPRFKQLLYLVILDVASEDSDEEKAKRAKLEDADLDLIRKGPEYKALRFRFAEEVEAQRAPKTFAEHVDDLVTQDKVARGLIRDTLYDNDGRVRTQAAKVLSDRVMAPKREAQEMRHVFVRADDIQRLTETERQLLESGEDLIIEGESEDISDEE